MPKQPAPKCPTVSRELVEWLEKAIPEPQFNADALQLAFDTGRRDAVRALRFQYELQQKKDS